MSLFLTTCPSPGTNIHSPHPAPLFNHPGTSSLSSISVQKPSSNILTLSLFSFVFNSSTPIFAGDTDYKEIVSACIGLKSSYGVVDETEFLVAIFAGHRTALSMIKASFTGSAHANGWIEVVEHAPRSLNGPQGFGTSQDFFLCTSLMVLPSWPTLSRC